MIQKCQSKNLILNMQTLFPDDILNKDSEYRACYRPDGSINQYLMTNYNSHLLLIEINNQYTKECEENGELYSDKIIVQRLKSFLLSQLFISKF